ncbi:MAG: SAM-dependent methyltransferase [Kiritimatiellia bacterium]|jgi:hypothetical protein|nr:SAM-dependent methyltransferase [Kiritimatiellia bacterium]MDP6629644.1 SAM-dependent methyltransferase [Kiritimatiellia bacterium]MDP6811088.1 SAM-dependent methyltransferase [Kiritimatiellia bacterium]MDP7024451.1 SAM-dependent methyltransferase [Kiritimatiellia bacterium]
MTQSASLPSDPETQARFLVLLRENLDANEFIKLTLGKYRGQDPTLRRILVRPLTVKGSKCLSFVTSYKTRDVTENMAVEEGLEMIGGLLGNPFKSAHLFTATEDVQLVFSRKGKCAWSCSPATCSTAPTVQHNREKQRLLDPASPFLVALGVTNEDHQIIPSMSRKWKQINRFLEVFDHAFTSSQLSRDDDVRVVDFGSGRGYLTFAMHEYLRETLGVAARVTGIELREDLVTGCSTAASTFGGDTLEFRQGDIRSYAPESIQVLIALHACDTATDLALHLGIRSGAEIIMCAPCCHKQIRKQMQRPPVLDPMLQFGVHLGQEAEMVTDTLRALLLEAHGYRTRLLEFVSLEHTSKNKMLLGIKHSQTIEREVILAKVAALKAFYGIQHHELETLLQSDAG